MVVIFEPSCITARVRHALMRRPSAITVQAPHWPWSQPFLVPVSCRCSRRASSRVVRVSRSMVCGRPFTSIVTLAWIGRAALAALACAQMKGGSATLAAVTAPTIRKVRREIVISQFLCRF
ncbi:hypothetical protein D3C76_1379480 [compost metagenome]